MPKLVQEYNSVITCPTDIIVEKRTVRGVVVEWNHSTGHPSGVRLEVTDWKSNSYSSYGAHPQTLINKQVFDRADLAIGIFSTRFGSPTEIAGSGTEEEIRRAIDQKKPLMLYFSDKPVKPSQFDNEQYQQVLKFKKEYQSKGIYYSFSSNKDFEIKFRHDLASVMNEILNS